MKSHLVSSAASFVALAVSLASAHVIDLHDRDPAAVARPGELPRIQQRDGLDYTAAAKVAIDAMNQMYNEGEGRWQPEIAWWLSGYALQDLLDYMYKTGSRDYMDKALYTIDKQKAPLNWWHQGDGWFRADSTDDTAWWALAMLRMFDLTNDQTYVNISLLDEAYMYQYWTESECNGGMYVDIRAKTYKNAIANELYMLLTASLHNRIPGDTVFLDRAKRTWDWLKGSDMINKDSLFNDGLVNRDGTCVNNELPVRTYNQGVVLGALTELYRATNDESYLSSARKIADAVLASGELTKDGVLAEHACEPDDSCNHDQQIFKGIFARHLSDLSRTLGGDPYRGYLERSAKSAYEKDRDAANNYDTNWQGPFRSTTLGKQASAASLFISLI